MSMATLMRSAKQIRGVPCVSDELPYHLFDEATHLFINTTSLGMGLRFLPLAGAGDSEVSALNTLFCSLPEGNKWCYQIELAMDHRVGEAIDVNERACQQGHSPFAGNGSTYARYGARHSFDSRYGEQCKFDLRRHTGRVWVSTTTGDKDKLLDVMEGLTLSLNQMGMRTAPCDEQGLIQSVRDAVHFDRETLTDPEIDLLEFEPLASQATLAGSEVLIRDNSLACRFTDAQGKEQDTTVVTLGLQRLPEQFHLFTLPNCLADLSRASKAVTCPVSIHLAFILQDSGIVSMKNERKINSLEKWATSPMAKLIPGLVEEFNDRKLLQSGLRAEECKLARCTFTVVLKTTDERRKRDTLAAESAFSNSALRLLPNHRIHAASLLNTLPFMPADGFFDDMARLKLVRTLKTSNLVNFTPVVADPQRVQPGLLLPTFRRSIYYFDPFEAGGDNFNIAIAAASGSGKSFLTQALAKNQIDRGGLAWILDNGNSYWKFTLQEGGTYLSHEDIALNPFTHLSRMAKGEDFIDDDGETVNPLKQTIGDIVSLFAILCSPNQGVSDHQRTALLVAISRAWETHGDHTLVDHVQAEIERLASEQDDDRRMLDLAFALTPYRRDGIFGEIFNHPSQLDPNNPLTTLELSGFKGDVLRPVVFALMVNINQAMYLSGDRTKPKMCIIEEAWKLMSGSDPAASEFIEEGYRTARKFRGSFVTVTQGVPDFFKSSASEAAYNNSDVHIYLRQGPAFTTYTKDNPNAFTPHEISQIKAFPEAKKAGFSSLMLRVGGRTSFHRFFCDPYSRALFSTEAVEFTHLEKQLKQGVDITTAVIHTARTFYKEDIAQFEAIKAREQSQVTETP